MSTQATITKDGGLLTSEVRLLFNHLEEPQSEEGSGKQQYSGCLLIDNSSTELLELLRGKIAEVGKAKFGTNWNPSSMRFPPLRSGSEKESDTFSNSHFMNVKSQRKPMILGLDGADIAGTGALYGGCYGRALLTFYTYDRNGNKGVSVSISAFQKIRDGEPMGQTVDVMAAFANNPLEGAVSESKPF